MVQLREVKTIKNQGLLERIEQGDHQAEQQLVERFYKPLFFILNNQCRDAQLSSDLCQDTFIIVLNKARNGEINNEAGLHSFIRSVGINLLIDYKRKGIRQKTDAQDEFDHISESIEHNTETKVEKERLVHIVSQVINELPTERDRQILQLTYGSKLDKAEICQKLSLTNEHYDRVLSRSKQRLKQLLVLKLNLKEEKFSLIDLFTISLIFSFLSTAYQPDVRETAYQEHYIDISTLAVRHDGEVS